MTKIRVLVVEDSLTVRKHLVEVLRSHPDFEVVGEAEDGKGAIECCQRLRPDVVTLDMMLPGLSGLAATETIMAYCPTPIVIVSASTNRGELFKTYDALAAGAVEVIEKPRADDYDVAWQGQFLALVRQVARVKVITHPRARLRALRRAAPATVPMADEAKGAYRCVAIGVSTGGPQALAELLGALPAGFPLPLLVVMHIAKAFGSAFTEWLAGQLPLPVSLAEHDVPLPEPGRPGVFLAPPDYHLFVEGGRLRLNRGPEVHSCRPSVDVLFESVAQTLGPGAVGVLMTGMGRDGARGLLAIRNRGGMTIAQDEATSVVFGMPREAILLGAATHVLPLPAIAPALVSLAHGVEPKVGAHEPTDSHRR